ncbi:MAG: flagellar motor protein MotB [Sphingomonadaceae bacterium]
MGPAPEPEILVKKVRGKKHAAHHGGAWKVAYADFVTAMMAFFLLMWLLGATDEQKRKGIADYFAPTIIPMERSGGSNGVMGGRSLEEPEGNAPYPQLSGPQPALPFQTQDRGKNPTDMDAMREAAEKIRRRVQSDPGLRDLGDQIRMTVTEEGLRIELIDKEDYSMFRSGTADMDPRARAVLGVVAEAVRDLPNRLAVRGHTDSVPFANAAGMNNWTLSTMRAESTRAVLARAGIGDRRFQRLEGVADTEPFIAEDPTDPRNRRMSVTLLRENAKP